MSVAQTVTDLAQLHDDLIDLASNAEGMLSIEFEPVIYLLEGAELGDAVVCEERILELRGPLRKKYEIYLVELLRHDDEAERRWTLLTMEQIVDLATDIEPDDLSWAQLAEGEWQPQ